MAKHKKGRKRKSKLSEAAAQRARAKFASTARYMHPEDEDPVYFEPPDFQHSCKASTGWRCLSCKYGFHGEWLARPNSQAACPRCFSEHIQQQDARYICLNCDHQYWEFPGGPLREQFDDPSCPNPDCKKVFGPRHPGSPEERGSYVEWEYEAWLLSHPECEFTV